MNTQVTDIYKEEAGNELHSLLNWWMKHMPDEQQGGFYGKINNNNTVAKDAPKGLVLNSRILWTFSAAFSLTKHGAWLPIADRAYRYLADHFSDDKYGGFYWSVQADGSSLDTKKQVYGQAFAIYALAEYYKITADAKALELAQQAFYLIEKYSFDPLHGGYLEAFGREWNALTDVRLSHKDQNDQKSMNTHLHVVEAYTNLYAVWKDEKLAAAIKGLLRVFDERIIDTRTRQQHLFFAEDWTVNGTLVSFGHDIEASWLLCEAAETTGDETCIATFRHIALQMADAAATGIDADGGMWHEYNYATGQWEKEKHWWPQAEAMVGFLHAWQISGEGKYLHASLQSWAFVKTKLRDPLYGEWYWGLHPDGSVMTGEDKAGFWKCPYHNGRACMEILKRL